MCPASGNAQPVSTRSKPLLLVARQHGSQIIPGLRLAMTRCLEPFGDLITLPHAERVIDRWHLVENGSHAFLGTVPESMRQVRRAVGTATVSPKRLTAAERVQYQGNRAPSPLKHHMNTLIRRRLR